MIGVLPEQADQKHYCSSFCGVNKVDRKKIIISRKKVTTTAKLGPVNNRTKEEYEERRSTLRKIKARGKTNSWIAERLQTNPATVSCYISGKYNITDQKWDRIKEMI